jgi:hypothetical protein
MQSLKAGVLVGIRCTVQPGPFSDERLVSFDTVTGPVTGFVREANLKKFNEDWCVKGTVISIESDIIEVRVEGSFFTTNGIATIPREMALAA